MSHPPNAEHLEAAMLATAAVTPHCTWGREEHSNSSGVKFDVVQVVPRSEFNVDLTNQKR